MLDRRINLLGCLGTITVSFLVALTPSVGKADEILSDVLLVVPANVAPMLIGKNWNQFLVAVKANNNALAKQIDKANLFLEGPTTIEGASVPFKFTSNAEEAANKNIFTTSTKNANGKNLEISSLQQSFTEAAPTGPLSDVVVELSANNVLTWSLCNDLEGPPDKPATLCGGADVAVDKSAESPSKFVDVTPAAKNGMKPAEHILFMSDCGSPADACSVAVVPTPEPGISILVTTGLILLSGCGWQRKRRRTKPN
jgi:hypothetical protein